MDKPHLTLVDPTYDANYEAEFLPLPFYPWDERPPTVELTHDEAATAIHLAEGELIEAAQLLKITVIRLQRLIRHSPRLARVHEESFGIGLVRAVAVPLKTLKNPNSDQRAQEWASTKVLQSRLAMGHPLSPAPASSTQSASLTVSPAQRTLTFRWKTDADDATNTAHEEKEADDAG